MKIVVFGPERRVGALQANRVVDVALAHASYLGAGGGLAPPAEIEAFIAGGEAVLDKAAEALRRAAPDDPYISFAPDDVHYHAPTVRRARVACAGGNSAAHFARAVSGGAGSMKARQVTVEEVVAQARARAEKDDFTGFWKAPDFIAGPYDDTPVPSRAKGYFDYEGETAIIIGKPAKGVRVEDGDAYIWGVSLAVDWSIRNWPTEPRTLSLNLAKVFDGSFTLGPCAVVHEELDPGNLMIETRVNGELRQSFNSGDMIFSVQEYLAHLSRDFTFLPGDVIANGTGPGTAMDSSKRGEDGKVPTDKFLKAGDVVEVSCDKIGALRTRLVA